MSWMGGNGGCTVVVASEDFDDDADGALDFPGMVVVPCVCRPWD